MTTVATPAPSTLQRTLERGVDRLLSLQHPEGYWKGDLKEAYDEYLKELKAAGYQILFDELEDHDSEVSWSGEGRSGQVALRDDCGGNKIYVHITNRPA